MCIKLLIFFNIKLSCIFNIIIFLVWITMYYVGTEYFNINVIYNIINTYNKVLIIFQVRYNITIML